MRTAIDLHWNRRHWLAAVAAAALGARAPLLAARPSGGRFAAAWQAAAGYQVGVLEANERALSIRSAVDVPTRAHALAAEPDGTLLTVARRPGDWLLRWRPDGSLLQWAWIEPDRAFNGHALVSADGKRLYTTEADLDSGDGLVGVRDRATLRKLAEWPTHGADPHALLLDASGDLMVANGGIRTRPETGRAKLDLDRMDASVVRLDAGDGRLRGQWRIDDARLSLRHLAWSGRTLAIAMQAEHSDPAAKAAAPVLALWDGRSIRAAQAADVPLLGYGGDVACAGRAVAVSCPRADGVAVWHADGRWHRRVPLDEACALAADVAGGWWAGGASLAMDAPNGVQRATPAGIRLDNHWLRLG
ncbi:DUF1513 domain-containing protein [Schlegelella sp. S2-27]|uniref:DUF1513 domain-containing protein n=1 Tax=Caldimonas mangrovi TaxID=2944811 RepID=A0ABT0YKN4_9BURK|nr:DUF1513 domain-containing protein [Caldimonas mangrovi]MCM5679296.1 DUF1513 domain-containing protein [Caldimonas mangrovi]